MPRVNIEGVGVVNFPDDMTQDQIANAIESELPTALESKRKQDAAQAALPPDLSMGEAAKRAVIRGGKQVGSAFGDIIPAIGASALGYDDYAKRQMEEAAGTQEEIARKYAPGVPSYKDVQGLGSGVQYAVETIGEQIPNLATALVPGGVGAMLGRRAAVGAAEAAGLGTKEAAELLASRQALGQNLGIYLGSYSQNAPEIFQNIYDTSGQLEPSAALLFSSVSAALDSAFPAAIMNKLTKPAKIGLVEKVLEKSGMEPSLLRKITAAIPQSIALEGLTEGAQEAISLKAENFINKNAGLFNSEGWNRILESSIRGGIAGGAFGAAAAIPERLSERAQAQAQPTPTPEPTPEADILGIKREPAVQEMRTQDGLPITRAGEVDTARVGETLQVPGQPTGTGLPTGTTEDLGAGAPGVTTNVESTDGREAAQSIALDKLSLKPEVQEMRAPIEGKESQLDNFMKDLDTETGRNPFNRRAYVIGDKASVEATPFEGRINVRDILSFAPAEMGKQGSGGGTAAINVLTKLADKHGVELLLDPQAYSNKGLSDDQLVSWYKRKGFKFEPGWDEGEMIRRPKQSKTLEARQQIPLTQEQVQAQPTPQEITTAEPTAQIPTTQENAQTITDTLKKEFGNNILTAQKRGLLNIVHSVDQLPAEIQSSIAPNAVGAYSKGKSYIIANRMTSENARRTLLHEVGEHHLTLEVLCRINLFVGVMTRMKDQ